MKLQDLVHNWLLGGADPQVGLRLFIDYCSPNKAVARIISKSPEQHLQTIRLTLLKKAELPYTTSVIPAVSPVIPTAVEGSNNSARYTGNNNQPPKLRNQWPFLANPECPSELKLLISDKITAYRNCVQEYDNISNATSTQEQHNAVRSLVTNFINNHNIYKELKTYKDTGKVLGQHAIFAQYQRLRDLRELNTMDLFKKKKNLEHAIWRNESNIKKSKRPDLLQSRQEKIKELKMQLAEVDRLLS